MRCQQQPAIEPQGLALQHGLTGRAGKSRTPKFIIEPLLAFLRQFCPGCQRRPNTQLIAIQAHKYVLVWPNGPAKALHKQGAVLQIVCKTPRRAACMVVDHTAAFHPKFQSPLT